MEKSQIEEKINNLMEEILTLRDQNDSQSTNFKILKTKLGDLVWKWGKIVFGDKISNAGVEIMNAFNRSLINYKKEDGAYIPYMSRILKNEIENASKKNNVFEKEIIKIPDEKRKFIKNILKYAEYTNKDINNKEHKQIIASSFNLDSEYLDKLLQWNNQAVPLQDSVPTSLEQDSDFSFIENSSNSVNIEYKSIDNNFLIIEDIKSQLLNIEDCFNEEKSNTNNQILSKQYLAALITRQIVENLYNLKIFSNENINALLKNYSFYSKDVLDLYTKINNMTLEKTAALFNKDKTDASRKMKDFRRKLEILSTNQKIKHNIII